MSNKEQFADSARAGNILVHQCIKCGNMHLLTVHFCQKCGSSGFEGRQIRGTGQVETYTIITVPPSGFAEHVPYAWVVLKLDGTPLRVSGFMASISSPDDLPVGTRAHVIGFDERGIIIQRE